MDGDAIQYFFQDLNIKLDDPVTLVVSYMMGAK